MPRGLSMNWTDITKLAILCVGNLTIIGSDNGLSPGRRQAIIWTNGEILWNFDQNWYIYIQENAFENVFCEMASILSQPQQSGTKPNLVAKIWPPNLVTICVWLPKMVDNVSSQFHHLVKTGLNVGSLARWLPLMVAHTCKLDTIWMVYISRIENGPIRL